MRSDGANGASSSFSSSFVLISNCFVVLPSVQTDVSGKDPAYGNWISSFPIILMVNETAIDFTYSRAIEGAEKVLTSTNYGPRY